VAGRSVVSRGFVQQGAVVTDGLVILAAWVMFAVLLAALVTVVLRGGPRR
jgi:hypothetical protein